MGYDTLYTITITAATKIRRREIASEIIKHAWLPYQDRVLQKGEFKDPVLKFQNRGWRTFELLDLSGKWYDQHYHTTSRDLGNVRGIELAEGEKIYLVGKGDDDADFYRIIVTHDSIIQQRAATRFIDKTPDCPNDEEGDLEENERCPGCGGCATIEGTFSEIYEDSEVRTS
jgi:hypothetical protein